MSDKYVCTSCIEDKYLADVIRDAAAEGASCDYCDDECVDAEQRAEVAQLDHVIDYMRDRINREWCDPAEELPYDGREGGYQGTVYDIWELLETIGYEPSNGRLTEDIMCAFMGEHWCRQNYFALQKNERLKIGWDSFSIVVKHSRRYTFWTMGDPYEENEHHPDYTPIGTLLHEVGSCAQSAGLVRQISSEHRLWRVRVHDETEKLTTGKEIGSPPRENAVQPNRMSPEGVSMFYGAADFATACAETVDPERCNGKIITGGAFHPVKNLKVLDLFKLAPPPSFWADVGQEVRLSLSFLHDFRQSISKPIERGRAHHLEYIPTQAFTEYVRFDMKPPGEEIHGICYPSSRNGKCCYVIFADNQQCQEGGEFGLHEQLLELDESTLRCVRMDEAV